MSKSKLLIFAVIILFLINIITLSFFIIKGSKERDFRDNRPEPKEIVIKKLHFDNEQISEYEKLIQNHRDSIFILDELIKKNKNILYNQLSVSEKNTKSDSIFKELALIQTKIEKLHYNHFLEIKKICKPNQINNYNELTNELSKIFNIKIEPNR